MYRSMLHEALGVRIRKAASAERRTGIGSFPNYLTPLKRDLSRHSHRCYIDAT